MTTADLLRGRKRLLLFKLATTEGEDPTPTPEANGILVNSIEVRPQANLLESKELRGLLDEGEFDQGGMSLQIPIGLNLKPGPDGATEPECSPLLQVCGLDPEANDEIEGTATGGTTTTVTVNRGVDTDFPADDGALVGQPIVLGFDPPVVTAIMSYAVSGGTVTIGLGKTLEDAPTDESVLIPANILYTPMQDEFPDGAAYIYEDGRKWIIVGCRGTLDVAMDAGGKPMLNVNLTGLFSSKTDEENPSPDYQAVRPGIWRGGAMTIDAARAAVQQLTLNLNNVVALPGDPNAAEGFLPPVIPGRDVQGSMNPFDTLVATRNLFQDMRDGVKRAIHAMVPGVGGHYTSVICPNAKYRDAQFEERDELLAQSVPFSALALGGEDPTKGASGLYLAFFYYPTPS